MSFQIGPPQQSGLDVILGQLGQGLGAGVSSGLQDQLKSFQEEKIKNKQLEGLSKIIPKEKAEVILNQPKELQKPLLYQSFAEEYFSPSEDVDIDEKNKSVPQNKTKKTLSTLSDNDLQILLSNPILAKSAQSVLDQRRDVQKEGLKSDIRRSDKYLDKVDESRETVRRSKSSLQAIEQALEQRNLGFFSPDNLKSISGFSRWISPEGNILNTAGKEFFLADIERVVGRPNQFLEKILSNALPQIGKSNEANQVITEFYKNQIDIQEERNLLADELSNFYREKMGYVPGNIGALVDNALKPYAKQKEKELTEIFQKGKEKFGKKENKPTITAINPETGEKLYLRNNKWSKK